MDNKQKCLCLIAILLALMAFSYASSVSISTNASGNASGNVSNSGGVSTFVPDKVINSSGVDIGNSYTTCFGLGVYCYVGVTNYPNASVGDNFQSHFTTPINFSNLTIYSIDDSMRGIADLYINGNLIASNIDFYKPNASTLSKKKISLGGTYPPGYYNFTIVITGKNASSTGYVLHISQMALWMEGHDNYNQSFDGVSDVNYYSFNQTFVNGSCSGCINLTQLNEKVNKSGDNMTGALNMSINDITNVSKETIINTNYNVTSSLFGTADMYMVSAGSTVGFYSFGNVNSFSAYRFNNNGTYNYSYLTTGQQILSFAVGGFNTTATTTNVTAGSAVGSFRFEAADNWNSTHQPTRINYLTNDGTTNNIVMTMQANKSITIPGLAGVGNASVCVHADGTLYRGSPGC